MEAANPTLTASEVEQVIRDMWMGFTEEEKEEWIKKDDEDYLRSIFFEFKRSEVEASNPTLTASEVDQVLKDMWMELTDEEKEEVRTRQILADADLMWEQSNMSVEEMRR